jgi:hypothetical protein
MVNYIRRETHNYYANVEMDLFVIWTNLSYNLN